MKHCWLLCAALLAPVSPLSADTPGSDTVTLAWDYPSAELNTNLTFKLYHSTNPTLPLAQWMPFTNIAGTNLSVALSINVGVHFFFLTASNWWGESDPSNVASTPAPPRSGVLVIRRGKQGP